mgnify:FL=1
MEELNRTLEKQATTDALTGIYNRMKFNEIFEQLVAQAIRYKINISLIMFDIDNFKLINDTYGHQAGDTILKEITKLIHENIRHIDTFARWGGEEFMILTPHTDEESAFKLAEKLREIIRTTKFSVEQHITCSFGVTQFKDRDNIDSFLKQVDDSLYRSKHAGKDRVEVI